ncbi:unnamed protein product, partial [marine sediment metagenome]
MYLESKQGQVLFYGLMLGLTILVLALALAQPVKQQIDNARNLTTYDETAGLDCNEVNGTISNYNKAACVVADLTIFHFIGG